MADNTNKQLDRFKIVIKDLVEYIGDNVPQCADTVKIAGFKLEAALDIGPTEVARRVTDALYPFSDEIADHDESFISGGAKSVPFLEDIDLEGVWCTLDTGVKDQLWKRLNKTFILASMARSEGSSSSINSASPVEFPDDMAEKIQSMMPMIMGAMGPMLGALGKGAGGGNQGRGGTARDRMQARLRAKQAASADAPLMKMAANALNAPPERENPPSKRGGVSNLF